MSTHNPERRTALRSVLVAGCALCAPGVWGAERSPVAARKFAQAPGAKVSKGQAKYQEQPKGDQMCANCMHFIPESSTCQVVEGKVSPQGWSMLWAKKQA